MSVYFVLKLIIILMTVNINDVCYFILEMFVIREGNRAGRAGLGLANSGLGQNRAWPKLARFFWAKILTT